MKFLQVFKQELKFLKHLDQQNTQFQLMEKKDSAKKAK